MDLKTLDKLMVAEVLVYSALVLLNGTILTTFTVELVAEELSSSGCDLLGCMSLEARLAFVAIVTLYSAVKVFWLPVVSMTVAIKWRKKRVLRAFLLGFGTVILISGVRSYPYHEPLIMDTWPQLHFLLMLLLATALIAPFVRRRIRQKA